MTYLVVFEKAADGEWGAYVPDLPGCTAVARSKAAAKSLIQESVRLWIETAMERGWPVPAPASSAQKIAV